MKKKILAGVLATAMLAGISTNIMASSVNGSAGGSNMSGANNITFNSASAYTTSTMYADSLRVNLTYAVNINGVDKLLYASNSNTGTRVDAIKYKEIGESRWVESRHGMTYRGQNVERTTRDYYRG